MSSNNRKSMATTLSTGFVAGGVILTALTATGCDRLPAGQIAAVTPSAVAQLAAQPIVAEKMELRSKLSANHNETFLVHSNV